MKNGFYSTGQAARELGISAAQVRSPCENGVIAAETIPGGQWRVPVCKVDGFRREEVARRDPRAQSGERNSHRLAFGERPDAERHPFAEVHACLRFRVRCPTWTSHRSRTGSRGGVTKYDVFDGRLTELRREAERLWPLIPEALIKTVADKLGNQA